MKAVESPENGQGRVRDGVMREAWPANLARSSAGPYSFPVRFPGSAGSSPVRRMTGYPFDAFGPKHWTYLLVLAFTWAAVVWVGRAYLGVRGQRRVVLVLAVVSLGQELVDDLIRASRGAWDLQDDLPLHLCSLAMLVGVWALLTKRQRIFEVAYYWGFAAASQAILTPDNSRWQQGELDVFWNFLSHGMVILNVLWLVFVEGMRCRTGSWWRVFLVTNVALLPIALFNLAMGSNYFFICRKPGGSSPFLLGEWPWYLVGFEVLAFAFFWVCSLPVERSVWRVRPDPAALADG
jgi:hypothetical integral membrane protein (TIGR02206 family)